MLLRPPSLNDYPENQSVVISTQSRQQSHKSSKNKRKQSSLSLNKNKSGNQSNQHLPPHEETKSIKSIGSAASSKKNKKKQTSLHLNKQQKQTTIIPKETFPFLHPKQQQLQRDFYEEHLRDDNKYIAPVDQSQVKSFRIASQFSPLPNDSPMGIKHELYEKNQRKKTTEYNQQSKDYRSKRIQKKNDDEYNKFQKLEPEKKVSIGLLNPPKITEYVNQQNDKIVLLNPFTSIQKELNTKHFQQSQQFQDSRKIQRSRQRKIFKQNKQGSAIRESANLSQTANNQQPSRKNSKSRLGNLLKQSRQKKNFQSKTIGNVDNTSHISNFSIAQKSRMDVQRSRLEQSKMTRSRQKLKKIETIQDQDDDDKFQMQSDLNLSQSNKLSHNRKTNNGQSSQYEKQKQSLHFQFQVEKSKRKGISLASKTKQIKQSPVMSGEISQISSMMPNQLPLTPITLQSKPLDIYENRRLPTPQIIQSKPITIPNYNKKPPSTFKASPQIIQYEQKQQLIVTPLILQSKPLQRINSEDEFDFLKTSQKLSSKFLPNQKHVQALQVIKKNQVFFQNRQANNKNENVQNNMKKQQKEQRITQNKIMKQTKIKIEVKPQSKIQNQAKPKIIDYEPKKQQIPIKKIKEVRSPDVYEYKQPTKQVEAFYQLSDQQRKIKQQFIPETKKQRPQIRNQIITQKHKLQNMNKQETDNKFQRMDKLQQAPSTFSKDLSNSSRSQSRSKKSNQKKKQSQIKIQKTNKNTSFHNVSPRAQRSFYEDQNQQKNSLQEHSEKQKKQMDVEISSIPNNQQKSNLVFFSDDDNGKYGSNQDIKSKTDSCFYEGNHMRMPSSKPPLSRKSSDRSLQSQKSKKSKVKETTLSINKPYEGNNSQQVTAKNNNKIKKGSLMDLALRNKQSNKDSDEARSNSNASYQSRGSKYSRGGSSKSSTRKKQSVIKLKQNTLNPNLMPRPQSFNPSQTDPTFNKNIMEGIRQSPARKIMTKDCYYIDQRGRLVKQDVIMDGNTIYGTSYQNTNYEEQVYQRMKRASRQRRNSKEKRLQRSRSRSMSKKMSSNDPFNQTEKSFESSFYGNRGGQIQTLRDYLIPTQQVPLRPNIPLLNKQSETSSKYYQQSNWQQPKKQPTFNQLFTKGPKIQRKNSRDQINPGRDTSASKRTIPRTQTSHRYRY